MSMLSHRTNLRFHHLVLFCFYSTMHRPPQICNFLKKVFLYELNPDPCFIFSTNQKAEWSENGNCTILRPKTSIQSDFWARTDEEGRSASNKFQLSIERQRQRWIIKTFRTKPHRIQLGKFRLGSEKICQSRPISHLFTSFKSKSKSLLAKLQIANPNRNEKCRPRPKRLKVQTVQFPLICKTNFQDLKQESLKHWNINKKNGA